MLDLLEKWKIFIFSDEQQLESDLQFAWMSYADVLFWICIVFLDEHFGLVLLPESSCALTFCWPTCMSRCVLTDKLFHLKRIVFPS